MKRAREFNLENAVYLSPDDIRFSQDSIGATFANGKPIGETLDALVRMEIFVPEIPPILVAKEDGAYYTRNNRRLWVFKQLTLMNRCCFIPCFKAPYVPREQFTTMIGGHEIIIRGDHQSETLDQFKSQKRRETLKKIRNRQIADDAPRVTFTPRFEYMRDQKRRIKRAKRKLGPKPVYKHETFKLGTKESKDMVKQVNKQQDTEDYRPTKARKLEKDAIYQNNPSEEEPHISEHGTQREKENHKHLKATTKSLNPLVGNLRDNSVKFGLKGDKTAMIEAKLERKKGFENKEGGSNALVNIEVVIDLTGDDNDSRTINVKSKEKEKNNDVYRFTAKNNGSTLPVGKTAKCKAKQMKNENDSVHAIQRINNPRSLHGFGNGKVRRDNPLDHPTSKVSNDQITTKFDSDPSKLVQPRRYLVSIPFDGNDTSNRAHKKLRNLQNDAKNHFKRPDGLLCERRTPPELGQFGLPILNSQTDYITGSFDDQMLRYDRL